MSDWEISDNEDNDKQMNKKKFNEEEKVYKTKKNDNIFHENTTGIPLLDEFDKIIFKNNNDIDLLKYENYLFTHIRQYIKKCNETEENIDYKKLMIYLKWIADVSEYLSKKIKLPLFHHEIIFNNMEHVSIPRSSYKFCSNSCDCIANYRNNGTKNKKHCKGRHYVHNLVNADVSVLLIYLSKIINCDYSLINHDEILKSINTISFVINHMYNELSSFLYYGMTDIDKLHNDYYKR